jgi:diguanylate cyclase (GGDEF)-like protein/PAS domain S-box-containing protein
MDTLDTATVAAGRDENLEPIRVLLVEPDIPDGHSIRHVFTHALGRPIQVHWVTHAHEALAAADQGGIDAVLLSLQLPAPGGLDLLKRLREAAPRVVVLAMATPAHEEQARRAVEQGAQDYFIKNHGGLAWLPRAVRYLCERQAVQDALFREQEWAQVTLNSIGDAVLTTDTGGYVTYLNKVAEQITGWSLDEARGQPLAEVFTIIDGQTGLPGRNPALSAIAENRTVGLAADCVLIRRDGVRSNIEDTAAPIHERAGTVVGAVLVFHDVSHSRAVAQKMSYLAQHDPLTDLPNRSTLTERLDYSVAMARRHGKQVALLFLDLDNFKRINDSLGHATGDALLQSVAQRLLACIRATDTICRLGGDEFVILLSEIDDDSGAAHCAEKIQAAFTEPHSINGHELHVTLSMGISIYPGDGNDLDALIQNADTAMYHTKGTGRARYQFFRAEMNARSLQRLKLENSLHDALDNNEFVLHYQPQIDLLSGDVVGAEALLRWQNPETGLLLPGEFISVAEDCGLIMPIGRWVLARACRQIRTWRQDGLAPVPIAVNVSALEFREKGFVENVRQVLADYALEASSLKLELTESVLMQDAASSVGITHELAALGVGLVVDDFGTGYSSLNYLKRFPIEMLKIDQSFIRDVMINSDGSSNDDGTIIRAVIGMGRNLNQRVVAEGIETEEQLHFLRKHHCEIGQGFLFNRALPAGEFSRQLARSS